MAEDEERDRYQALQATHELVAKAQEPQRPATTHHPGNPLTAPLQAHADHRSDVAARVDAQYRAIAEEKARQTESNRLATEAARLGQGMRPDYAALRQEPVREAEVPKAKADDAVRTEQQRQAHNAQQQARGTAQEAQVARAQGGRGGDDQRQAAARRTTELSRAERMRLLREQMTRDHSKSLERDKDGGRSR